MVIPSHPRLHKNPIMYQQLSKQYKIFRNLHGPQPFPISTQSRVLYISISPKLIWNCDVAMLVVLYMVKEHSKMLISYDFNLNIFKRLNFVIEFITKLCKNFKGIFVSPMLKLLMITL